MYSATQQIIDKQELKKLLTATTHKKEHGLVGLVR